MLSQYNGFYFLRVPIQWSEIYVALLEQMAKEGIRMLEDCNSSCSGTGKRLISCWNMFNAACAAFEFGDTKEALVLIKYIVNELNNNYNLNFDENKYNAIDIEELHYKTIYILQFSYNDEWHYVYYPGVPGRRQDVVFNNFKEIYEFWEEYIKNNNIEFYEWFKNDILKYNINDKIKEGSRNTYTAQYNSYFGERIYLGNKYDYYTTFKLSEDLLVIAESIDDNKRTEIECIKTDHNEDLTDGYFIKDKTDEYYYSVFINTKKETISDLKIKFKYET